MKRPEKMPHREIYIGIDPGASGGIAVVGSGETISIKMPDTEKDVWNYITDQNVPGGVWMFAVIEKVNGYVGDGGNPGSAMFKFGASYGGLRMALTAAGIPFEEATPQRWQKALGIPKRDKGESKTQWKNRLKAHAQRLFPGASVTLATADALLIAEYCRRLRTGLIIG